MTDPTAVPTEPWTIEESETDRAAAAISGEEDHVGIADLWRLTMGLPHWWFVAVGEDGEQSPAAAEVDGQLILLTFTSAERARHFAVQQQMIGADDTLQAIALPPQEVIAASPSYAEADIDGLIFDAHVSGYFIPCDQLPVMWQAVLSSGEPTEG